MPLAKACTTGWYPSPPSFPFPPSETAYLEIPLIFCVVLHPVPLLTLLSYLANSSSQLWISSVVCCSCEALYKWFNHSVPLFLPLTMGLMIVSPLGFIVKFNELISSTYKCAQHLRITTVTHCYYSSFKTWLEAYLHQEALQKYLIQNQKTKDYLEKKFATCMTGDSFLNLQGTSTEL